MLLSPALAANYYVSPAGSDSNPGTLSQPWRTLNSAVTHLSPGDTLNIRAGTYNEWLDNNIPGGTSWTTPVTIKAYNNEAVTVRPNSGADFVLNIRSPGEQYIIVDGLDLDGVNTGSAVAKITSGAHHVRLIRCIVRNSPDGHGVLISSGDVNYDTYTEVINCVIYNNGVTAYGGGTMNHGVYISTRHNLVDGCLIFGNQDHAIHNFSGDASYNTYRNNRMYGNPIGIGIYSCTENYIYNNIAYSNGLAFRAGYGSTSTYFINNTAYKNVLNYQV